MDVKVFDDLKFFLQVILTVKSPRADAGDRVSGVSEFHVRQNTRNFGEAQSILLLPEPSLPLILLLNFRKCFQKPFRYARKLGREFSADFSKLIETTIFGDDQAAAPTTC